MSVVSHIKLCGEGVEEDQAFALHPHRILLVAVDASQVSEHAFDFAVEDMLRPEDELRIIHVQSYHEIGNTAARAFSAAYVPIDLYSTGKIDCASKQISNKFIKKCQDLNLRHFSEDVIMQDGSVGKAICRYIEKISSKTECQKVQLVMGARNLGFCARGLLGSVSDYCVRNASCPVTIFKG